MTVKERHQKNVVLNVIKLKSYCDNMMTHSTDAKRSMDHLLLASVQSFEFCLC